MKIKAIYDNESDIPEAYKDLYTEKSGKWMLTQVEGIKTDADVTRVQTALTAEKEAHKKTRDTLAAFGDLDPDDVHDKLDRFAELEIKANANDGKIDEKKIQEIVDQRVAREKAPIERENKKLKDDLTAAQTQVGELSSTITKGKIETAVRKAAEGAKVQPTAIDDVVMLGERIFEVTEDGKVVTKDNAGVTPGIEADVWLTDMQEKRPHWWPTSVGGGAKGNDGNKGFTNNPWSAANWNQTEQTKIVKEQGLDKANQMAKAAGSSVGSAVPPAPSK